MRIKRMVAFCVVLMLLANVWLKISDKIVWAEQMQCSDKTVFVPINGEDREGKKYDLAKSIKKQKAGPHCTWSLDPKGTMMIKGTGKVVLNSDLYMGEKQSVKRIIVSKGITGIGEYAFHGCGNVTKITLPDTVTTLGKGCFQGCEKLKTLVVPKRVTRIPCAAFLNCYSLKSVQLSDGLKAIQDDAFSGCQSLKKLVIPDSVTHMDKNTIRDCRSLKTVVLSKNLEKTVPRFKNCLALRKIRNRSSMSIKLDSVSGRRIWKSDGRKVKVLKSGQTATTKGAKYRIIYYDTCGGKVIGKRPVNRYYGEEVKLPEASREGYEFIGWRCMDVWTNDEEFLCTYAGDARLTAWFVKVEIESQQDGKLRILFQDDGIPWRDKGGNVTYGYAVRFRSVDGGKPIYLGYFLRGKEMLYQTRVLDPGEYFCDISYYYFEDDLQPGLMKSWYLPRRICIG